MRPGPLAVMAAALVVVVGGTAIWAWSQRGSEGDPLAPASAAPTAAPTAAATATTAPIATGVPALSHGPVPTDLLPSLATARDDLPRIYTDGCHADPPVTALPAHCTFGDTTAVASIVLFGDSHAAQWFPALEAIAIDRHLRLLPFTKSACASADVSVWSAVFDRTYTECATWREAVFARIESVRPAVVVLANDRDYTMVADGAQLPEQSHPDAWGAGLRASVTRLRAAGAAVLVIGDTVRQAADPIDCLRAHLADAAACSTPYADAVDAAFLATESDATQAAGGTFIDPTPWLCTTDPCPSILGRYLLYRDTHHLTATYSVELAARLQADLPVLP